MDDGKGEHERFILGIAQGAAELIRSPRARALLAEKCEEFRSRVAAVETLCKEAQDECEEHAGRLGRRWEPWLDSTMGRVIVRQFFLRAPSLRDDYYGDGRQPVIRARRKWPSWEAKVEEFHRRVELVEARWKARAGAFSACAERMSLDWELRLFRGGIVEATRRFHFARPALQGDPRQWFPPPARWWSCKPDARQELPDTLLRDCVLI